jgi:hypothetical protein
MLDEAHQMGHLPVGSCTPHGFAINRLGVQSFAIRARDRSRRRAGIVLLPDLGDAPFQSADMHLAQGTYDSRLARHTLGCRTQGRVQDGGMEPDPLPNGVRSATAGGERRTNECEYDAPAVPNPTSLAGVGEIGQGVHECAILLDVHRVPPAEFGRSTRVYLMDNDFDMTLTLTAMACLVAPSVLQ